MASLNGHSGTPPVGTVCSEFQSLLDEALRASRSDKLKSILSGCQTVLGQLQQITTSQDQKIKSLEEQLQQIQPQQPSFHPSTYSFTLGTGPQLVDGFEPLNLYNYNQQTAAAAAAASHQNLAHHGHNPSSTHHHHVSTSSLNAAAALQQQHAVHHVHQQHAHHTQDHSHHAHQVTAAMAHQGSASQFSQLYQKSVLASKGKQLPMSRTSSAKTGQILQGNSGMAIHGLAPGQGVIQHHQTATNTPTSNASAAAQDPLLQQSFGERTDIQPTHVGKRGRQANLIDDPPDYAQIQADLELPNFQALRNGFGDAAVKEMIADAKQTRSTSFVKYGFLIKSSGTGSQKISLQCPRHPNEIFNNYITGLKHVLRDLDYKPCQCPEPSCGKRFYLKEKLKDHYVSIHDKGRARYQCNRPGCHFACQYRLQFQAHLDSHDNIKRFKCFHEGCNMVFTTKFKLKAHIALHSMTEKFKCKNCDEYFPTKGRLASHRAKVHLPLKKCTYEGCDFETYKKSQMDAHIKSHIRKASINEDEIAARRRRTLKPWRPCPKCGKKYNNERLFKAHMDRHQEGFPYKCHICPSEHKTEIDLQSHLRMGHGIKPQSSGQKKKPEKEKALECLFRHCNFKSNCESRLKVHMMKKHAYPKPYPRKDRKKKHCEECGKEFDRWARLREHMLKSHDKAMTEHTCTICKKSYKKESELQKHNETHHSGPLKCPHEECGKEFTTKPALNKHVRRYHNPQRQKRREKLALKKKVKEIKKRAAAREQSGEGDDINASQGDELGGDQNEDQFVDDEDEEIIDSTDESEDDEELLSMSDEDEDEEELSQSEEEDFDNESRPSAEVTRSGRKVKKVDKFKLSHEPSKRKNNKASKDDDSQLDDKSLIDRQMSVSGDGTASLGGGDGHHSALGSEPTGDENDSSLMGGGGEGNATSMNDASGESNKMPIDQYLSVVLNESSDQSASNNQCGPLPPASSLSHQPPPQHPDPQLDPHSVDSLNAVAAGAEAQVAYHDHTAHIHHPHTDHHQPQTM